MNLRDLEYLVAVAEHGHFGRAAEACFVGQPTLSTQIKKLEDELGVELLERTTRSVMLTDVGAEVVERARAILDETAEIRRIARDACDPESGELRIGLFPTLAPYLLPHVMGSLRERFPRMEFRLVEEKTEEVLRRLRSGQLDAAVLALPLDDDGLASEMLFDEDFLLAAPASSPLAEDDGPVSTAALADQSVLLLEDGHCLRDQALSVCRMAGADEFAGFRATSLETLRHMVAAGVGVTLIPRMAVSPPVSPTPGIAVREFEEPVPHRRVALLWRPTSPRRRIMPDLAEVLREIPADLVHVVPGTT